MNVLTNSWFVIPHQLSPSSSVFELVGGVPSTLHRPPPKALLPILRGVGEDVVEAALEQFAGVGEVALNVGLGFVNGGKRLVQNLHNPLLLFGGWERNFDCPQILSRNPFAGCTRRKGFDLLEVTRRVTKSHDKLRCNRVV